MGLIHELRGVPPPIKPKQKEQQENTYQPFFLTVIKKKGTFLISENSLYEEEKECFRKTKTTLKQWLKENKLKIIESNVKDHYKIYY